MHIRKNFLDPSKIKSNITLLDVFQGFPEKTIKLNNEETKSVSRMLAELQSGVYGPDIYQKETVPAGSLPPQIQVGGEGTTYRFVLSGSITIDGVFFGLGSHIVPPQEVRSVNYQTGPEPVCLVDVVPDEDIVVLGTEVFFKNSVIDSDNDQLLIIRKTSDVIINDAPAGVENGILTNVLIMNDQQSVQINVSPNEVVGVLRIQRQPDTIIPDSEVPRP